MKVTNSTAVPVYTVSGSSSSRPLPEWLVRKRKRSLKNDPEYANRIELLQDFHFEEASHCVRISEDGDWLVSTGTYKPQHHVHNLPQLSLSYERHTSSLNTTFQLLSSDYSKSIHLQSDRSIEFHTPSGCQHQTRIPRYGRDLQYDRRSAEALIPAVGVNANGLGEVYRLNLELGRFMRPYELDVDGDNLESSGIDGLQGGIDVGSVNTAAIAEESHNLHAFGTSLGTVEFWDPRSRRRAAVLPIATQNDMFEGRQEVTALQFYQSGMSIATGSSSGIIQVFDLRSTKPFLKRDQGYGTPIHTLIHLAPSTESKGHMAEPKLLSADKRMIKIWDENQQGPWTSMEPAVDLNSVAWYKDSGMLMTANEGRQQHTFFIPQLGPAPRWCTFLDNLVEEMAEDPDDASAFTTQRAGEVYANYKFLTMQQLQTLNLDHLVGTTSLLRPYMHGFFVPQRLYEEARLIANPFVWEEQRAKRVQERIEKERDSRIRGNKKVTAKVNRQLAQKVVEQEERRQRNEARKVLEQGGDDVAAGKAGALGETSATGIQQSSNLMTDTRFAALFENEDYAIDENSDAFKALNPNKPVAPQERKRGLTAVEQDEIDDVPNSSDEASSSEGEEAEQKAPKDDGRISTSSYRRQKAVGPQMHVKSSVKPVVDRTFGSRKVVARQPKSRRTTVGGDREISFMPSKKQKPQMYDQSSRTPKGDRRSASGNTFRRM